MAYFIAGMIDENLGEARGSKVYRLNRNRKSEIHLESSFARTMQRETFIQFVILYVIYIPYLFHLS